MSIRFDVKADFKKLGNWVEALGGKQIPFVTAKSLTNLAGEVQKAHTKQLSRTFRIRNRYVANSFRTEMAKKSDWPYCYAKEGSQLDFMRLQSVGGMKTDKRGLPLGVPLSRGEWLAARPT